MTFTPEQRHILESAIPTVVRDVATQREYVVLDRETYDRLKILSQVDVVPPSFFEFKDLPDET